MKAGKTVIFIFCVMLGLALLCLAFNGNTYRFLGVDWHFPTLAKALTPSQQEHRDELAKQKADSLQDQLNKMHGAKMQEFEKFCKTSPARFYMPGGDADYLDDVFAALDNAKSHPVRIMHYGDSQIECDFMTSDLREYLQSTFGGSGVGLVPAVQPVETVTLSQSVSPELQRYSVYGSKEFRATHNRYGPMGAMSRLDGSATFNFTTSSSDDYPHSKTFGKVSVAMKGSGSFSVTAGGKTYTLKPATSGGDQMQLYSVTLDRPVRHATLHASGHMDLYGFMLDGTRGVVVDNISMRGCSGTIFTQIDNNTIAPFFSAEPVSLIILQFGGNNIDSFNSEEGTKYYTDELRKQIAYFHKISPRSKILFIGPGDMATRVNGELQTYPCMTKAVAALRKAANESGAAFWDLYSAMGGNHTMIDWVNAEPRLAERDYTHFTHIGAQKAAKILNDTFGLYYKFYRLRTGKAAATSGKAPAGKSTKSK